MSREEKYNGWTNRETWLFNLWFGDHINCEGDYWIQKSCFEHDYYELCGNLGNTIFNDMLDINLIDWNDLLTTYKSDWND